MKANSNKYQGLENKLNEVFNKLVVQEESKFVEQTQKKINRLKEDHKEATYNLVDALEKNINNPGFVLDSQEYYKLQTELRDIAKQLEIQESRLALGEEESDKHLNSF